MRYAVLGASGVGGLVGGALAKAGHPMTLLVRPGRRDHYPERLSVQSEALEAIPPDELGSAIVVPLLNGVDHIGELRDRYGPERVLPGAIRVEAEQTGPGRVRHLSSFADVQVAPNPATRERAETLCEELRDAGVGCE